MNSLTQVFKVSWARVGTLALLTLFFYFNCSFAMSGRMKIIPKPNNPPKINSVIPVERSTFVSGDTIKITIQASDPDKDKLQFRYSLDNKIIKNWANDSKFSLKTTSKDIGRHVIKVEVRDNKGKSDSKSINIFVFMNFPKPS